MRDPVLVGHVVVGSIGLVLGPAYLISRGPVRWVVGVGYHVAVLLTALTAAVLSVISWEDYWWLLPIAILTEVSAVVGVMARRREWPGWRTAVPHLLGGSYIALVTAFLVVRTGSPVFWVLPAVVGQWPIAVAKKRLALAPEHSQRAETGLARQ